MRLKGVSVAAGNTPTTTGPIDIPPCARQEGGVSDTPDSAPRYVLAFLTNEWEWREDVAADSFETAKAAARQALERVVREESPELACVTLVEDGARIGVWDWVLAKPYWTPL